MNRARQFNVSVAALALPLCLLLGYRALAQRPPGPKPPVAAAVRIEPLFDGLIQRADAKAEIAAFEDRIDEEQQRREQAIRELEADLENTVAAGGRAELADAIALERLKLRFWLQEARQELELEKALRLQDLYNAIKEAIAELADAEGYDMVVVNDILEQPSFDRDARVPAQVQLLQQITASKLLYLDDALDITDDLITRMNNKWRAAHGG